MSAARKMLTAARAAGYRESGATVGAAPRGGGGGGDGRVMVGVRCSLRLEAPVADGGELLVPDSYIRYLVGGGDGGGMLVILTKACL